MVNHLRSWLLKPLALLDRLGNRLYTWRYNPLYHSGSVAILSLGIALVTGLYLVFFYRIGAPYDSITRIAGQTFTGSWIRSLHRYAADLAVVAVVIHAWRMFAQARSWGPRALAWTSGLILLLLIFVCGWTGYVMVWDTQGQLLAVEGARVLDALPLFSEPISRAFAGDTPLPNAFFFMNLFLHIAIPVGMTALLWLHLSKVARPVVLPPKPLLWTLVAVLGILSVGWPAALGPEADLLRIPREAPLDFFYGFWFPVSKALSPLGAWAALTAITGLLATVPLWTRPKKEARPLASKVAERLCTGCEQCAVDCPYEAITMISRTDGRDGLFALVTPELCVSCGICSGSCAPMGVGPPTRTGRDQLATVRQLIADSSLGGEVIVIVACTRGSGGIGELGSYRGAPVLSVQCSGNLHTSSVEYLLRAGAGGVLIATCPPRDCWSREGTTWMLERLHNGREAELQPRVDARRIRVVFAGSGERHRVDAEFDSFQEHVRRLNRPEAEEEIELDMECVVERLTHEDATRGDAIAEDLTTGAS